MMKWRYQALRYQTSELASLRALAHVAGHVSSSSYGIHVPGMYPPPHMTCVHVTGCGRKL